MALHLRKRGEIWHARGTVRVGKEIVHVPEFSTGCRAKTHAEAVVSREESRIRADHIDGAEGRARRVTIADCFAAYLTNHRSLKQYDKDRIASFNEAMGLRMLAEANDAWREWLRDHPKHKPSTVARWRSTLTAALAEGAREYKTSAPKLERRKSEEPDRVVYLTVDERRRLLAAYNQWAACPVLLLAYQGPRTQEALRLDWRRIDFNRKTLHIIGEETKSRRGRTVPMHDRVEKLLYGMWCAAERPQLGPGFLSRRGRPYADTRGRGNRAQGGNPLAKAHETACRIAGVERFRVHDWRHDWAARMVIAGTDLYTLMKLGGWSSLRMVQRYASVTGEHMADAVSRLA